MILGRRLARWCAIAAAVTSAILLGIYANAPIDKATDLGWGLFALAVAAAIFLAEGVVLVE